MTDANKEKQKKRQRPSSALKFPEAQLNIRVPASRHSQSKEKMTDLENQIAEIISKS